MVNLFFLQVKFRSFLEILETFEKTVFWQFLRKQSKTYVSKISKNDQNLTCKKQVCLNKDASKGAKIELRREISQILSDLSDFQF